MMKVRRLQPLLLSSWMDLELRLQLQAGLAGVGTR